VTAAIRWLGIPPPPPHRANDPAPLFLLKYLRRSKAVTYALVIMVVGLNPAMTNIPGFKDRDVCINEGKALSDKAAQPVSDYGKILTYCVEVK
jgi:hypothetical protein